MLFDLSICLIMVMDLVLGVGGDIGRHIAQLTIDGRDIVWIDGDTRAGRQYIYTRCITLYSTSSKSPIAILLSHHLTHVSIKEVCASTLHSSVA